MERRDNKILILICVPVNDALIHEKVIMIEYFRKTLKSKGYKVKIFNKDNFDINFKADILFLIADYGQLATSLSYSGNWIKYIGENVNLLIGDGIARRINDEAFITQVKDDILKIKTLIVNPIFRVTDDKSLTYLASFLSRDILKKLKYLLKRYKRSFIIKPNGGSGGAGVIPVSKDEEPKNFERIIRESKKEFFTKFMKDRDPYPYTIQEKANFSLINWREGNHTFDLRIYLAQDKERIIPVGGLARIARGNFTDGLNKQEFVVNLSGYDGQIEVERGIGFSKSNCKLLNLSEEDFVNMFCIGCVIFATIVKNHKEIINFSEWDKVID